MSQTPLYTGNHLDIALGNLLQQYKDKPKIVGLASAIIGPLQPIEDAFFGMLTLRSINYAVGIQLDKLGVIVGQPRNGLTDEPYRSRIKIRILQNISQGEPDTLIAVYQALTNSDYVLFQENYPAGLNMFSGGDIPAGQETIIWQNIQEVAAAGVRVDYLTTSDNPEPFCVADGLVVGGGCGDLLDPLIGGPLAEMRIPVGLEFAFAGGPFDAFGFGDLLDPIMGGHLIGD